MNFLIDECVPVELVDIARKAGHQASFVGHIGIHPGLVCLNCEQKRRCIQLFISMFKVAIEEFGAAEDLINTVIEITQTGNELEITRYIAPAI